jgi:DNA invertase Pin-like site-specific DNA recombinase
MRRAAHKNGRAPAQAGAVLGYARVSTNDQDLSVQLDTLRKAGATAIFREKASGAHSNRPALKKMVAALRRGDLVIVTRLDRLGRSVRELLNLLADFEQKGVGFRSLSDPWADTTSPHGKLMVTILGGLAEFERSLIIARTSEGRARAKANGVRFGRPRKLSAFQISEAIKRRNAGEAPSIIAQSYRVSSKTILRLNGGGQ